MNVFVLSRSRPSRVPAATLRARGHFGVVRDALRWVRCGCSVLLLLLLQAAASAETSPAQLERLRQSAENGSSTAQYTLGLIYADPTESTTDPSEAFVWLSLAVRNGASDRALNKLVSEATPAALAEGRRRLAEREASLGVSSDVKVPPTKTSSTDAEKIPLIRPDPVRAVAPVEASQTSPRVAASLEQELINLRLDKKQLAAELALARQETEAARKETADKLAELTQGIERRERELTELKTRVPEKVEVTTPVVRSVPTGGDSKQALEQLSQRLAKKEEEADLLRTRLMAATSVRMPVSPDGESATQIPVPVPDPEAGRLQKELATATAEVETLKAELAAERAGKTSPDREAEARRSARLTAELERVRGEVKSLQTSREEEAKADALKIDQLMRQVVEKDRAMREVEGRLAQSKMSTGSSPSAEDLAVKSNALRRAEAAQEELTQRLAEERRQRQQETKLSVEERERLKVELERERAVGEKLRLAAGTPEDLGSTGNELKRRLKESEDERVQLATKVAALSLETASLKVQLSEGRGQRGSLAEESRGELEKIRRDLARATAELTAQRGESVSLAEKVARLTTERDAALQRGATDRSVAEAQARVEAMERNLAASETERKALRAQLDSERSSTQDAAAQIAQLSTELTSLRKSMVSARELNEAREELETLRRALVTREIEEKSATGRLELERNRAEASAAEVGRLTAALAEARAKAGNPGELEALKQEVASGERQRDDLNQQLVAEQRRNAVTSAQVGKLMAELEGNRSKSVSAEEFARTREEVQTLKRSLGEIESERNALVSQVESERRGRVDSAIRAGALAAELEGVRRESVSAERLEQVQAETENLRRALAASEAERERVNQQYAAAKRSYAVQSQEFERAIKALANLDTERASLASQLSSSRSEPARRTSGNPARPTERSSANDQVSAELALLREQLRLTQQQSEDLIREVNQMKTRAVITQQGEIVLTSPGRTASSIGENSGGTRYHTVVDGDSLSSLARKYYGSPNRWADIEAANRDVIGNPNSLRVGARLRIP